MYIATPIDRKGLIINMIIIVRKEGLVEAKFRDTKAAEAWIGHPYVDIIDNKRYGMP